MEKQQFRTRRSDALRLDRATKWPEAYIPFYFLVF